jgi:CHAD domain-containing protein
MLVSRARDIDRLHPAAREDQREAVHDMRVATRRLRSALATGRPFLNRDVSDPVRDELGWLSDSLGAARDAEVRGTRVREALADLVAERADIDWRAGEVEPALLEPLLLRRAQAHAALVDDLDSRRYADLIGHLHALVADPPWTPRADEPIRTAYRRRLRRELRTLDRRMRAATGPDLDPVERAARLHGARKAVKRARYAAEPLRPLAGKRARKLTKRLKSLQSCLGLLQDTVITREYLDDLVHRPLPSASPSVALVAGALIEREASHAETHEAHAREAWERVGKARLPR